MGMPIGIDVRDPDADPTVLDRAFDWLRWVDGAFSTYRADSEISRLNRGDLQIAQAHPDVRTVLDRCEQLRFQTSGFFDIRSTNLPPEGQVEGVELIAITIDPSGLVKGWSVERAAELLQAAGARNFSINAGGDVRVHGNAIPDTGWRIGIQHPYQRDKVAAVVAGTNLAIATSGAYARGNHIYNPHTGESPSAVLSVTIAGHDLGAADAYATATFAMDAEGPEWTTGLVGIGYEAMTILADETVLSTPGFPAM